MGMYLLANHLINFAAPAATVAVLLVLLTRLGFGLFATNRPFVQSAWVQTAIVFVAGLAILVAGLVVFVAGLAILVAGLVVFGRDGKMLTYTALVVGAALCQWVLIRGWSKA